MYDVTRYTILSAGFWLGAAVAAWLLLQGIGHNPWREGRLRGGAVAAWVSLVGLAASSLNSVLVALLSTWQSSTMAFGVVNTPELPTLSGLLWVSVGSAFAQVLASLFGVLAALWFGRQVDWRAVKAALGWSLGSWQWVLLALAVAGWLAWPVGIVGMALSLATTGAMGTAMSTALGGAGRMPPAFIRQAAMPIGWFLALAIAAWPARGLAGAWLAARAGDRRWIAGLPAERRVVWIGVTGFLAAGLVDMSDQLLEILGAGILGLMSLQELAGTSDAIGWYLPLGVFSLAALLVIVWRVWTRFPWSSLETMTAWRPSSVVRALITLAIAATLLWPLDAMRWGLQQLQWSGPDMPSWGWQAVGAILIVGGIIWLLRWQPGVDAS